FDGNYSVIFRVYNNGVAYRFVTNFRKAYQVKNEWIEYKFPEDVKTHAHVINSYRSSFEKHFTPKKLTELSVEKDLISLPLLIESGEGSWVMLTESDQSGYPGLLYRRYSEENIYSIRGVHAPLPLETRTGGIKNFNKVVTKVAPYIAEMPGRSELPWRLMIVEKESKDLIDNTLVYQLAEEPGSDFKWVKYGKVAWDWYNALNLKGVDFETGLNTETYKYYIDFAADNGIEYIILDEGWSDQFDIRVPNPEMDLKGLIKYGKERNVELILWSIWYPLENGTEELFQWVKELGVAGLKIDFFDRNDQKVMVALEKLLQIAAKYELLIDFHGCPTLAGMERTYPNLITYEAVKGNEFVKWDPEGQPPSHNVSLAFTRNVVGPMDYTPGAMRNATQKGFSPNFESPMSKSTRAHQAGMYVVYFSPLQMLCDAPTSYIASRENAHMLDIITSVPTTWDETSVMDGRYGEYAIVARKKHESWYVGGLNNEAERVVTLKWDFLDDGRYRYTLLKDGVNANRQAEDFVIEKGEIVSGQQMEIIMKQGGGFLMTLEKKN
ncbi:MAG: glycoside hydrolase family 97 catalytic domain-containing protein, partial [Cyclobacteriaceae bacterium]